MFKTILWIIYLLSVVGLLIIGAGMRHQAREKIKNEEMPVAPVSWQTRLTAKIFMLIFCLIPIWNTLTLVYSFCHQEELMENFLEKK